MVKDIRKLKIRIVKSLFECGLTEYELRKSCRGCTDEEKCFKGLGEWEQQSRALLCMIDDVLSLDAAELEERLKEDEEKIREVTYEEAEQALKLAEALVKRAEERKKPLPSMAKLFDEMVTKSTKKKEI